MADKKPDRNPAIDGLSRIVGRLMAFSGFYPAVDEMIADARSGIRAIVDSAEEINQLRSETQTLKTDNNELLSRKSLLIVQVEASVALINTLADRIPDEVLKKELLAALDEIRKEVKKAR